MRELQLEGFAPTDEEPLELEVMYKGPFRSITDDDGRVYARGRRVQVSAAVADQLRASEFSSQFVVFPPQSRRPKTVTACGS